MAFNVTARPITLGHGATTVLECTVFVEVLGLLNDNGPHVIIRDAVFRDDGALFPRRKVTIIAYRFDAAFVNYQITYIGTILSNTGERFAIHYRTTTLASNPQTIS